MPIAVEALETIDDVGTGIVTKVERGEAQTQALHVVGKRDALGLVVGIGLECIAMTSVTWGEDAASDQYLRELELTAHLRGNLRGGEDGETQFSAKDERAVGTIDGAAFEELIALYAVGFVEGLELTGGRIEVRETVERAYPDGAVVGVGQQTTHVVAHVGRTMTRDFACGEIELEQSHAEGGNPDVASGILGEIAAAEKARLVEGQVVMTFGHRFGRNNGDATRL